MEVGSAGGNQVESPGEFGVLCDVGGGMLAMEDLNPFKPGLNQLSRKSRQVTVALREAGLGGPTSAILLRL